MSRVEVAAVDRAGRAVAKVRADSVEAGTAQLRGQVTAADAPDGWYRSWRYLSWADEHPGCYLADGGYVHVCGVA